jgi:hypothetical protein
VHSHRREANAGGKAKTFTVVRPTLEGCEGFDSLTLAYTVTTLSLNFAEPRD